MKVKDLKEYLTSIPDDYDFELGKCFAIKDEKSPDPTDFYEIIFDSPIIGVAQDDKDKHFRLVLDSTDLDKCIDSLGTLKRFPNEDDDAEQST